MENSTRIGDLSRLTSLTVTLGDTTAVTVLSTDVDCDEMAFTYSHRDGGGESTNSYIVLYNFINAQEGRLLPDHTRVVELNREQTGISLKRNAGGKISIGLIGELSDDGKFGITASWPTTKLPLPWQYLFQDLAEAMKEDNRSRPQKG